MINNKYMINKRSTSRPKEGKREPSEAEYLVGNELGDTPILKTAVR